MSANFTGIGRGPARVDPHVAADAPARLLETLQERPDAGLKFRIVRSRGQENADETHPLALLRARRERPRRSAAEQRDERAAFHSITSSARASNVGGRSIPSAFAVFRLMTSSNFVGCWTGRSAGLAPFKIRPAYVQASRKASEMLAP